MNPARYRPDIDGLRALAVLSVLFYHAEFALFSGGYIGVDIFFVISGFLITRLIVDEIQETGGFRFGNFYLRRIRRLFPALCFTLFFTLALALPMLSPALLSSYGASLASAVVSSSNFWFWSESGYFDTEASFKPLLHTWSLSVEEQFYLIWPLLLFILIASFKLRTKGIAIFMLIAGVGSLGSNMIMGDGIQGHLGGIFTDGPATIFFLTPFRVFEFAIGAMTVWALRAGPSQSQLNEILVPVGLVLCLAPVFIYNEETPFPTYNALLPCIGTAMLIYAGQARVTGRILNNRLCVGIGLTSYSLYLIHWPLLVFYKFYKFDDLILWEQIAVCAASILAAWLMYRFIEQPFRKPASETNINKRFLYGCAALAIILTGTGIFLWKGGGLENRYPQELQKIIDIGDKVTKEEVEKWNLGTCYIGGSFAQSQQYPDDFNAQSCLRIDPDKTNVMIIGDSNAGHLMHGLEQVFTGVNFLQMTSAGCRPFYDAIERHGCRKMMQFAFEEFLPAHHENLDYVVLIGRWFGREDYFEDVTHTAEKLSFIPKEKLLVMGDQMQFKGGVATTAAFWGKTNDFTGFLERKRIKYEETSNPELKDMLYPYAGFIEPHDYICDQDGCHFFLGENYTDPVTRDGNHLTPNGAVFFARKMKQGRIFSK